MRIITNRQYDAIVEIVTEQKNKISELESELVKKQDKINSLEDILHKRDESVDYLNELLEKRRVQVYQLQTCLYKNGIISSVLDFQSTSKLLVSKEDINKILGH